MDGASSPLAERFGPYRLLHELGRGGQGVVWLAEDTKLGRKVALKVLNTGPASGSITDREIARFQREAEAASSLDHPNICALLDAGDVDGAPYLAFRHIEGETLVDKIEKAAVNRRGESTSTDSDTNTGSTTDPTSKEGIHRIVAIFEKIARALHKAHEKGLIHRDIKPGNIMLTDDDGEPVVLDFGLARQEFGDEHSLTHSGDLLGTPAYMSPEQLMAHRVPLDRRTDIYSLGATLYEVLTLERPFNALTRAELYQQILHEDPKAATAVNRHIPRDLQIVLETAMEKDRNRRYQTALDLAEDLRRFREFEPIKARPIGRVLRLQRWAQRHPVATVIAVVLAVGVIALGAMLLRVQTERNRAIASALGSASAEVLPSNPRLALLLGLDAIDRCTDTEQRPLLMSRIHAALAALRERRSFEIPSTEQPLAMRFDPGDRSLLVLYQNVTMQRIDIDGTPMPLTADEQDVDTVFPTRPGWDNNPDAAPARAEHGQTVLVADGSKVRVSRGGNPDKPLEHGGKVMSVHFSRDGRAISAALDGKIRVWTPDLQINQVFHAGANACFEGRPERTMFSPDGKSILSSDMDRNLGLLWNLDTPTTPRVRIEHGSSITHLSFYPPDSRPSWILSTSFDQIAKITSVTTGATVAELRGHSTPIHAAAVTTDGKTVATVSTARKVILWDVAGELPAFFAHEGGVMSIRFSSDGLLITSGRDGWVRIWTPEGQLKHQFDSEQFKVLFATDTPRQHVLVRDDRDNLTMRSRDGKQIQRWSQNVPKRPNDGLVILGRDGTYRLERVHELRQPQIETAIETGNTACYSPDRRLAIFNWPTPEFVNLVTGERWELPKAAFYFGINHEHVVGSRGEVGLLCDHRGAIRYRLVGHEGQIFWTRLSPTGDTAITLSRDRTARLWSTKDGRLLAILPHEGLVKDAEFTKDGKQVYTASFDGWVRCWFVDENELLLHARKRAAAFSYTEAEKNRLGHLLGR